MNFLSRVFIKRKDNYNYKSTFKLTGPQNITLQSSCGQRWQYGQFTDQKQDNLTAKKEAYRCLWPPFY